MRSTATRRIHSRPWYHRWGCRRLGFHGRSDRIRNLLTELGSLSRAFCFLGSSHSSWPGPRPGRRALVCRKLRIGLGRVGPHARELFGWYPEPLSHLDIRGSGGAADQCGITTMLAESIRTDVACARGDPGWLRTVSTVLRLRLSGRTAGLWRLVHSSSSSRSGIEDWWLRSPDAPPGHGSASRPASQPPL